MKFKTHNLTDQDIFSKMVLVVLCLYCHQALYNNLHFRLAQRAHTYTDVTSGRDFPISTTRLDHI